MDKAVQTGFRYEWIPDYVIPVLDRELGCDNQSLLAIAVVDKLLEVVLLLSLKFFHSEVIKDQQIRFCQSVEEGYGVSLQTLQIKSFKQPLHVEVRHRHAGTACAVAQGGGQIAFPGSGRAGDDYRVSVADEITLCKLFDQRGLDAAFGIRVYLFDQRRIREGRIFQKTVYPVAVTCVFFSLYQKLEAVGKSEPVSY